VTDVTRIEAIGTRTSDFIDAQHVTSVDAQLHGLETYINPDVNAALHFTQRHVEMVGPLEGIEGIQIGDQYGILTDSDLLGVALIQPVTTGIEYLQMDRELYPTRRSFVINVEPVSTMLSFEDLQLVEVVLSRWSTKGDKKSVGLSNTAEQAKSHPPSTDSIKRYELLFNEARLGLGLKTEGDKIVVSSLQNNSFSGQIHQGDSLISIDRRAVRHKTLEEVVKMLGRSQRPVSIQFERIAPQPSQFLERGRTTFTSSEESKNKSYSCNVYSLEFHLGVSLGLELEESNCAKFPVVSKILPTIEDAMVASNSIDASNPEQIEIVESVVGRETTRIPRVGAVVVAIDDVPIEEIGVDNAWALLSKTQRSLGDDMNTRGTTFRLTFQEIKSELWGKIDSAEVSISGISLSFIDDLNGRDMPLFRGKLSTLEFHAERGLGVDAYIIDCSFPSLLSPLEAASMDDSFVTLASDEVRDIRSESITSLSAIGRFSIDYFHPRVSYWEPLLEPSQIFFLLEQQDGSIESSRPAQVAVEMSDRLPRNHFVRASLAHSFRESSMVPVNVTDAAAEVLFQTLGQWKNWRKDLAAASNEEDLQPDNFWSSPTMLSVESSTKDIPLVVQQAAEQKAAQAALNFAQKRGAETSKNRDTSKPFILRNRTGVSIAFVQQGRGMRDQGYSRRRILDGRDGSGTIGEYRGLERYEQKAITELADQEDAKFDMDLIDSDFTNESSARHSSRYLSNKVRSYEGRYPNLTIAAQAISGVILEPLTDLQVFKVGSTRCNLQVKKETVGTEASIHSVCLIWNVEIEDNRRILTLSSAVRLVSSVLDIPIEVGVREIRANSSDDNRNFLVLSNATSIGLATSNEPFYLPLWLALRLDPVEISVKPTSNIVGEFDWSEQTVVSFTPTPDVLQANAGTLPVQNWIWKQSYQELNFVRCDPKNHDHNCAMYFAVFGSSIQMKGGASPSALFQSGWDFEVMGVLSITLDSCLTIRNMLPLDVSWEVSHTLEDAVTPIPSSFASKTTVTDVDLNFSRSDSLRPGECAEVSECNSTSKNLRARFKQETAPFWSSWASLKLSEVHDPDDDPDANDPAEYLDTVPNSAQVNVEVPDRFGIPLVLGVRIVPKLTTDDPFLGRFYGLEVIVYAELWIRNITSLPLNFGCPTHQLRKTSESLHATNSSFDESIAKFTAESALMEIANLLEVGDKGTGLNQAAARKTAETGTIASLPQQEAPMLVEEVFEYVEVDGSIVRRRWWASESFDSYRQCILDVDDVTTCWKWIEDSWVSGETESYRLVKIDILTHFPALSGNRRSWRSKTFVRWVGKLQKSPHRGWVFRWQQIFQPFSWISPAKIF
jgi:hypothetical protein